MAGAQKPAYTNDALEKRRRTPQTTVMKLPVLSVLSLVVLVGGCSTDKQEPDAPSVTAKDTAYEQDLELLQGTWKPVSMEMDGERLPNEKIGKTRLTLEGENFTFDNGTDTHAGKYKIDPGQDPKQLDIVIERGEEVGKVYLVIYKFENGKMIQCMQVSNENRPTEFTGQEGSGNLYEIWERVQ